MTATQLRRGSDWALWQRPDSVETLLLRPNEDGGWWSLPGHPRLNRDLAGRPVLSLTLVLSRRPQPDEESIHHLVELGHLGLELSLAAFPEVISAAVAEQSGPIRPQFARAVTVTLEQASGATPLVTVTGTGVDAVVALSVTLLRAEILDVLAALARKATGMVVRAHLEYDTPATGRTVRLRGRWLDVHTRLAAAAGAGGTITGTAVRAVLAELLADGTVQVTLDGVELPDGLPPDGSDGVTTALLKAASFVLRRETPELPAGDPTNLYSMRPARSPAFPLDLAMTTSLPGRGELDLCAPLGTVLGGVLEGMDADRYIRLVVPETGTDTGTGFGPAPRRQVSGRARSAPVLDAAIYPGGVRAMPLVLTPDRTAPRPASASVADAIQRPILESGGVRRWSLDDMIMARPPVSDPDPQPPLLPLVNDPGAPIWPDAARRGVYWYAPSFVLLPVSADTPRDSAGFLFNIAKKGETGLTGSVRFRLRPTVPPRAAKELAKIGATGQPVPTGNLSVTLEIPFQDTASGQLRSQLFVAVVRTAADSSLVADIDLLDSWVRLAYGVLSLPGFQSRPAALRVSYAYTGCTQNNAMMMMRPASGGKHMALDMDPAAVQSIAAARITAKAPVESPPTSIWAGENQYTIRTMVEEQNNTVLYPCGSFPGVYRQQIAGSELVIGCQDVLRLGEVAYRQFAELTQLSDAFAAHCRIYRSLQQPGYFLIVPARYRITRYGPDERPDWAYRPVVHVYAILGQTPAEHRYIISATVEPDLPPDIRHDLDNRLIAFTPDGYQPRIVMPTAPSVQATDRYTWATGVSDDVPQVRRTWDTLQITLSTGLANSLLVTRMIEGSGYSGTVTFTLPDGLAVDSHLLLDSYVSGPWRTGPVTVELAGGQAKLVNRIERTVTVSELVTAGAGGAQGKVAVATAVPPGGTTSVAVPAGVNAAWPRCTPAGGPLTIEELDVFVEDVLTELVMVDLIAHAAHKLAALQVKVRVRGSETIQASADLKEQEGVKLKLTLPLTKYLQTNSVEFRFTRRMTSGDTATSKWLPWDMSTKGNVISVTWDLIQ